MAKANPYDASDNSVTAVTYSVSTSGDALFQSTISSSDSPDYTAAAAEANTQCLVMNPLAVEVVS